MLCNILTTTYRTGHVRAARVGVRAVGATAGLAPLHGTARPRSRSSATRTSMTSSVPSTTSTLSLPMPMLMPTLARDPCPPPYPLSYPLPHRCSPRYSYSTPRVLTWNLSSVLASSRSCAHALAPRANTHLQAGNHSLYLASGTEPLPSPPSAA